MKIKNLDSIKYNEVNITDISVIRQTNLWSSLYHKQGRIYNGFLLMLRGNGRFAFDDKEINLLPGGLIYLPKGSRHRVTAKERSLDYYRISFTLRDNISGEEIIFSEKPFLLSEQVSKFIIELCEQMRRQTMIEDSGFSRLSRLSELLDFCTKLETTSKKSKIGAAIDYINLHYTEEISISELTSRTYMSEAQLFRLFKKEFGLSPIEYKNELRIKKAEALLCDPECTVGEIAAILGFENACYFSRLFKKMRGMSPADYKKTALSI